MGSDALAAPRAPWVRRVGEGPEGRGHGSAPLPAGPSELGLSLSGATRGPAGFSVMKHGFREGERLLGAPVRGRWGPAPAITAPRCRRGALPVSGSEPGALPLGEPRRAGWRAPQGRSEPSRLSRVTEPSPLTRTRRDGGLAAPTGGAASDEVSLLSRGQLARDRREAPFFSVALTQSRWDVS